jgi:LacI family transcriptional regulator
MVKLKDLAKELGISVATVSNALSGKGRVSEKLAKKIRDHAASAGYKPSAAGRALKTGRSGIIGFVLPSISYPLFSSLVQSVEIAADEMGYGVFIADGRGSGVGQLLAIQRLKKRGVDGVVVVPQGALKLNNLNLPVAIINTPSDGDNTCAPNHEQGGALIAEHFLKNKHQNFVLIGEDHKSKSEQDKIEGMTKILAGVAKYHTIWANKGLPTVDEIRNSGVSAILTTSDLMAMRMIGLAQQAGFKVPEDFSVAGFDDSPICEAVEPKLTSVRADMQEVANRVVEYLIAQIENKEISGKPASVEMELVVRETSDLAFEKIHAA